MNSVVRTFDHVMEFDFKLTPGLKTRREFLISRNDTFQVISIEALTTADKFALSHCTLTIENHQRLLHSIMLDHVMTTDGSIHARVARLETVLHQLLLVESEPEESDEQNKRLLRQRQALKKLGYSSGAVLDHRILRAPLVLERASMLVVSINCDEDFPLRGVPCRVSLGGDLARIIS